MVASEELEQANLRLVMNESARTSCCFDPLEDFGNIDRQHLDRHHILDSCARQTAGGPPPRGRAWRRATRLRPTPRISGLR